MGYAGTNTELVLPDNYNGENYYIYSFAFADRDGLTSVVIPNSVTNIGAYAFCNCSSLMSVMLPDSVTRIDEGAFAECLILTNIVFEGTVSEWYAITIGYYWNYDVPATEVVCSDGTVKL